MKIQISGFPWKHRRSGNSAPIRWCLSCCSFLDKACVLERASVTTTPCCLLKPTCFIYWHSFPGLFRHLSAFSLSVMPVKGFHVRSFQRDKRKGGIFELKSYFPDSGEGVGDLGCPWEGAPFQQDYWKWQDFGAEATVLTTSQPTPGK